MRSSLALTSFTSLSCRTANDQFEFFLTESEGTYIIARVLLMSVGELVRHDAVLAFRQLTTVCDEDLLGRRVALDGGFFDEADDGSAVNHSATAGFHISSERTREGRRRRNVQDNVLAVEVRGGYGGDEELTAVGACGELKSGDILQQEIGQRARLTRAGVGHRKEERLVVLEVKVLVLKLLAVDRLAASSVTRGEVPWVA